MTDYIIIALLVLIWVSNTRYGARFGDLLTNAIITWLIHPIKRLSRKVYK